MKAISSYWDLVEPVWESISVHDGPKKFLREFSKPSLPVRTLFAAHWCQSEVRNGGLAQFFFNPTGVLAPEAVQAFSAIGMPETSSVLSGAMARLGSLYPRDTHARHPILEGLDEDVFETMDNAILRLLDSEAGGFEAAADRYASSTEG